MQPAATKPFERQDATRLLHWDDDMALGCSSQLFFCLWRGRTTLTGVNRLGSAAMEFTRTRELGLAIITIIEPQVKVPEPGAREALTHLLKCDGGRVLMSA